MQQSSGPNVFAWLVCFFVSFYFSILCKLCSTHHQTLCVSIPMSFNCMFQRKILGGADVIYCNWSVLLSVITTGQWVVWGRPLSRSSATGTCLLSCAGQITSCETTAAPTSVTSHGLGLRSDWARWHYMCVICFQSFSHVPKTFVPSRILYLCHNP